MSMSNDPCLATYVSKYLAMEIVSHLSPLFNVINVNTVYSHYICVLHTYYLSEVLLVKRKFTGLRGRKNLSHLAKVSLI